MLIEIFEGLLGTGVKILQAPPLAQLRMMGNQVSRMLLTMAGGMGVFKDEDLRKVYELKAEPLEKVVKLLPLFFRAMLRDPEFHEVFGTLVDAELSRIYVSLAEYMDTCVEKVPVRSTNEAT